MITLNNNVIYTNSNCSSVTSKKSSPGSNVYYIESHKLNRNKENRIVSLKPRKIYPLPLPKSVPHLSINFFTDHLFTNCIFRDGLLDDKCEGYLEKSEEITVKQKVKYSQVKKLETVTSSTDNIYTKPKTVAPDFKLREKRQLLKNHNFESDFQKIKPTRRLDSINTLIGTIKSNKKSSKTQNKINTDTNIPQKSNSNFQNLLEEIKLKVTFQNNKSNTDRADNIKNNNKTNVFNDKKLSIETTLPIICPIDNRSDIKGNTKNTEKISIYKDNYLKNLASKNPRINKNNILLEDNGETFNFVKSINVLHINKYLQKNHTRTAKEGDKLPQCELYRYNKLIDINKRKLEPEDLSKSIICFNNSSIHCTEKSEFNSFHNLVNIIGKTLLYDKILYIYTCLINKIEACVCDSRSQNLIAEGPNTSYKMVYPTKNQNITVGYSEESVDDYYESSKSKENDVSDNANNKTGFPGLICTLRGVFTTNISESLFLGPSLDEVLLGILSCLRHLAEQVGILKPRCYDICRCTIASVEEQTRELHKNNLDVVKWLHDEYINLATDVAEANAALEHKCPCTKDNCPVVLQSRRFVLDRLAELLEKKQELENAYRRKMNKCCQPQATED